MPNQNQSGNRGGGGERRGFAAMDEAKQREIASKGGRAAHQSGNAHEFTSEEAREAGRKGGEAVSRDRAHMAEIGAKGGEASGGGRGRSGSDSGGLRAGSRGDDDRGGGRSGQDGRDDDRGGGSGRGGSGWTH